MTFVVLFFGSLIVFVIFRKELTPWIYAADRAAAPVKSRIMAMPGRYRQILEKHFLYYQQLSASNKRRFEEKVMRFIFRKQFIPRNVDAVTDEAKVLISACAVQITFGLPNVYLRHFSKILVYPDDYYSSINRRYHKGEVNPRFGIIVLSWNNFVEGYLEPHNAINLGLHEMAHALRIENVIRNEEYDFFNSELLEQFDEWAHRVCANIDQWNDGFLRPYACTNVHEFFSVCVENFFEKPGALKKELPEVYTILVKLLNQDPMTIAST